MAIRHLEAGERRASLASDLEAARAARNGEIPEREFAIAKLTAREICALPGPEKKSDQLLGELLIRGSRLVIGGQTGEGKTTLALSIVAAVAMGREFLGWTGVGGRALVLDAEQGLKTVKRRLTELRLDGADEVDYARLPDGLSLDQDQAHTAAVEKLLAVGDYSVVLADPLYKLHSGDSNDERQAVDLMRRFDAWRETYGFALVLPVHCRKTPAGAKFSQQEFFGSTAYLRGAEVVIGLKRLRAGYSQLHFFKDRDGDLPIGDAWGLVFDQQEGFRRDAQDGEPRQTAVDVVRELLEAQPGMTQAQLIEASSYSERTVRDALRSLHAKDKRPGTTGEKLFSLEEEPTKHA